MPHDVFVSHSSKDKAAADAVVSVLEGRGVRCWIAPRDIPAGSTWGAAIIAGLEGSRVMVLIFSSSADASPQVLREVERAVAKGVAILPMRIDDVTMSKDMEYFLSARHWLDAANPPLVPHLERLAGAVCGILQQPRSAGSRATSVPSVSQAFSGRQGVWAMAAAAVMVATMALFAFRPWARRDTASSPPATESAGVVASPTLPPAGALTLPARYSIVDLGTLGGEESESSAGSINDTGQVVGDTDVNGPFVDGHPRHHAFLWAGGKMIDLGTLGGANSSAFAINNRGQIVGQSDTSSAGEPHAFLYDAGKMMDMGTSGGKTSSAYAINSAGDVVGKADTGAVAEDGPISHAFLYRGGKMTDLGTWGKRGSEADAINDSGRIVGVVFDRKPYSSPFIFADGQWIGLGSLVGAAHPRAINASGDVAGSAQAPEDEGEFHAFVYHQSRRYDLGTLGGKISYGYGIDPAGRVLGGARVATAGDTRLHAFIGDSAGLHDLNRLIPADAHCVLTAARSANAAGIIVGEGDFPTGRHAYVLTPEGR